jgi:hypothetical protein
MGHWPPVQSRPFSAGAAQTPADDLQTRPESGFCQNNTAALAAANRPFNFHGNSATQYSDANNNNNSNDAVQGNNVQNELWEWSSGAVGSAAPSCSDEPAPTADDAASSTDLDHVTGFTNEMGAGEPSGGSNEDPEMHRPSVCNWLNGLDPCIQMG